MDDRVRAKKSLGQHFLTHQPTAERIVSLLEARGDGAILEIGPGMGILTRFLLEMYGDRLWVVELDRESVIYLEKTFPELQGRIITGDFLKLNLSELFSGSLSVIGNFPYNISSQILFHVLDHLHIVDEVVGMFQREVGRRLVAPPGSKEYGILSVLLDAYFLRSYHFTVSEQLFRPPPKVKSGVVRFEKKSEIPIIDDPKLFKTVIKTAFNQRRKTLRNALSVFWDERLEETGLGQLRAERLSYNDYIAISKIIALKDSRQRNPEP